MVEIELLSPPQTDSSRALPNAVGAEKSLLSVILQDPETYLTAATEAGLTADDLYMPHHRTIFTTAVEMSVSNQTIELISLTQTLHDRSLLENVGGYAEVAQIYYFQPTAGHFPHHLAIVQDKATLRRAIATCTDIISGAYESPDDTTAFLDRLEVEALSVRRQLAGSSQSPKDALPSILEDIETITSGGTLQTGLETGFLYLDSISGGLRPGQLIIIAARPSMGKTALLLNIAQHITVRNALPGLLFSCEMTSRQLYERLLFGGARIATARFKSGFKPYKGELDNLLRSQKQLSSAPLLIDDTPALPIETLRAKARRHHQRQPLAYVGVDYLQLIRSNSPQATHSREREIAEISSGLKALAKELQIPVIALAQLNRESEKRSNGRPRMSDLRDSGSIEQDADLLGLLYRQEYYAETDEQRESLKGQAELLVAKNRNGPTGPVPLTWIDDLMQFENRADAEEPHY